MTDISILPDYFQEIITNSRKILQQTECLKQEIESLRRELRTYKEEVKDLPIIDNEDPKDEVMMSRKEAGKYLGVHVCTLERWEKSKHLVPTRLGGKIYYKKSELIK